ncbi:MAG TPA: lipocalin-like domain-containing protein [Casimicrobiaceae bacterium]
MTQPYGRSLNVLFLTLGLALTCSQAVADQPNLGEQIIGTWTYRSVDIVRADGSREPLFGANPHGLASFDGTGHYVLMTSRGDLPRFASKGRMNGTPEENMAVVHGSIAHFGRYTVSEAEKTITFHIETSTFPNWNGLDQTRPVTIVGDELTWKTPASTGGGTAEVVLRRLR